MEMKVFLGTTVSADLFKEIEQLRGREKRSTFVEYLLRLGLKEHSQNLGVDKDDQVC